LIMRLALGLVVAAVAAGCALPSRQVDRPLPSLRALGQPVEQPELAAEEPPSDMEIGSFVRRSFNAIDAGGFASVNIIVDDGIVTLTGSAANLQTAWRAQAAATAVKGVKEVRNYLYIRER
jgi:osmotically-inducible protein OsmY